MRYALLCFALSLFSTGAAFADEACRGNIARDTKQLEIARKSVADRKSLERYSQSELQINPAPLCAVLIDNVEFAAFMLDQAQHCTDDSAYNNVGMREMQANFLIDAKQKAAALHCEDR